MTSPAHLVLRVPQYRHARRSSTVGYTSIMEFKLGELFCGPGGLAVGATRADISDPAWKITHQWATDYDEDTCNTYRQNICPDHPESVIHADIRELDYDRLKELGDIDGLAFGFPCNDFSRMGEHKGLDGDYGPLYTYGAKALKVFQPKWFLAENVGGIRSANEGNAFKQILQTFEDAGYNLVTNLYKFEQYGVPQARHRIIIVGIRKDQNVEFKVPSTEPYKNCDVSAKTALTQPPITDNMTGTELPQTTPTVQERLSYIKPGENVFNANMPEHLRLKVKGATISQLYKRLHPDKPSYTVIGAGGGGTHVYHWKENRALTNRERARLQTFPDTYNFVGKRGSVRKQIGMAVPAAGAQVIFEAILRTFKGEEYPHQEPNIQIQ